MHFLDVLDRGVVKDSDYPIGSDRPDCFAASLEKQYQEVLGKLVDVLGLDRGDRIFFYTSEEEAIKDLYGSIVIDVIPETGRNFFATSQIEDAVITLGMERYQPLGVELQELPMDRHGQIAFDGLSSRVSLISLSAVQSTTGILLPFWEWKQRNEVTTHLRVGDLFGKIPIDFKNLPVEYLTLDLSKMLGVRGLGLLIVKNSIPFKPLMPMQEAFLYREPERLSSLRARLFEFHEQEMQRQLQLPMQRERLVQSLKEAVPDMRVLEFDAQQLPNVVTCIFPSIHAELLQFGLKERSVIVCRGGSDRQRLDRVLTHFGYEDHEAFSALTFAFDEVDLEIASIVAEVIETYRRGEIEV